ncbi:hypothetical protein QBZ16_000472 [Prototheca wickerhamii]|uniref:Uncharacterized protein n=1 Tax=Prototheca wickerhamii TaxID=3111 RepID=A0AAD9ILM1_PROWI|nr:hypothetical protein QBZ16_000472 [Prototheca wickerhamii]
MGGILSRATSRTGAVAVAKAEAVPEVRHAVSAQEIQRVVQLPEPQDEVVEATQRGSLLGQVARPRLSREDREELLKGRVFSRQLAAIMAAAEGGSGEKVAELARASGLDAELLRTVLRHHRLPLGIGSTTPGQLF